MTAIYPLALLQRNDEKVLLRFSQPLTEGITVEFFIKPSKDVDDDDPRVKKLSSVTAEIVITDRLKGLCEVNIPAAAIAAVGTFWYHVDAVGAGGVPRKTAARGPIAVAAT